MTSWTKGGLSQEVQAFLAGDDLEAAHGFTVLLLSRTGDGWPHLAMLSLGELICLDAAKIRLALWPKSTAADNLADRRQATLCFVAEGMSYSIRLSTRLLETASIAGVGERAFFEGDVDSVGIDSAPYATIESGVRFRLNDAGQTLAIWRKTRSALKEVE